MGADFRRASFSFAQYPGKSRGELVRWVCFSGVFTLTMNETMCELFLKVIDAGDTGDGLDDDVADLADGLDELKAKAAVHHIKSRLFHIVRFRNVFTVQMELEGLEAFKEAIEAGADYDEPGGASIAAFLHCATVLIEQWRRIQAENVVPQGYHRLGA